MDHGIDQGHIGVGIKAQAAPGMARQIGPARIGNDNLQTAPGRILHPTRRHGMIAGGIGANHQNQLGMLDVAHLVADGTRAQSFQQSRHAGGVAQTRAVVHIVGTKTGAHQFLEQIGFLIAALGRAQTRQCLPAMLIAQLSQRTRCQIQRLVPTGRTENAGPVGAVAVQVLQQRRILGHAFATNQWNRQALRAVHIVKSKATLDTQPLLVGRAITSDHAKDPVVLHLVAQQAADAAERTDRVHHFVGKHHRVAARWQERAGGASLYTLAAGHAGTAAHRVTQVEHDLTLSAPPCNTDDVVALDFAARTYATRALDAGIQVQRDRRVRAVARNRGSTQGQQFGARPYT